MRFYEPLKTPGANWAAATSLTLIAHQVAGKAVRDALFLSSYHAHSLPYAMASAAVLSLVAVLWLSRAMSRHSPAKLLPILFAASAVGLLLEWSLGFTLPRVSALLVYLHLALFGPTLLTTFWSLINERFDPHAAKRAVARIAGGGTLGGVLGALAAWRASTLLPLPTLLPLLAALNGIGVVSTLLIRRRAVTRESAPPIAELVEPAVTSPLRELRTAPFLRNLALLVAVGSATSTMLDYIFSAQAEVAFARGAPLLTFFALFWLGVSVVSFVVQVTLGRVALERLGLAVSIALLPGVIILGGALGMAVPGLASAALLRGGEAVQRNTLFRGAYELLYTPLSDARKRATKALIDVGFDRAGTVVGSVLVFAALRVAGIHSVGALLGAVVVMALATLPLARQLHVGYVEALQASLREGAKALSLPTGEERPRPTMELRARDEIIEQVEALQPGGLQALFEGEGNPNAPASPGIAERTLDVPHAALARTSDLLSGDATRVKRALAQLSPRGPSAACAILLLAHETLYLDALTSLRGVGPQMVGQLVDALLDQTADFVVRRRIPRVLAVCRSQRAAEGLLLGFADPRFEVRYQCGRALMSVTDANDAIVIERETIIETILHEIETGKTALETVTNEDFDDAINPDEPSSLMELLARDRVDRSLEHVFSLLSIHLAREPLRMAFRALHHDDARHRGTALEYLDTVLPAEVRAALEPYLGASTPLAPTRSAHDVLGELENLQRPLTPSQTAS